MAPIRVFRMRSTQGGVFCRWVLKPEAQNAEFLEYCHSHACCCTTFNAHCSGERYEVQFWPIIRTGNQSIEFRYSNQAGQEFSRIIRSKLTGRRATKNLLWKIRFCFQISRGDGFPTDKN